MLPGRTAYFRWQISNGALIDGNRSALGIDNISITVLAQSASSVGGLIAPEKGEFDYAFGSTLEYSTAVQLARGAALDLAIADWARTSPFNPLSPHRIHDQQLPSTSRPLDSLLMIGLHEKAAPRRNPCEFQQADSSRNKFDGHDEFLAELATNFGVRVFDTTCNPNESLR